MEVRDWQFWAHPEARVQLFHGSGESVAVLFGEAFGAGVEELGSAVHKVLENPEDTRALDELGGRWALFILSSGVARVYHDAMGARSVYWRPDGSVASHAALYGECFDVALRRDVIDFRDGTLYKNRVQTKYLPGDLTLYEEVYGLIPNNYVDLLRGATVRYWPREAITPVSMADLESRLDNYMMSLAAFVRSKGHHAVLGATGGADTRLIMAGLLRSGVPFETFTSQWKELKPSEQETIRELVRIGDLRHQILPELERGDFVKTALQNSSGIGGSSATVEWMSREFVTPNALFIIGHGGEVLRDDKLDMPSLDPDLWASAYARVRSGTDVSSDETAFVRRAFEGFFDRGNLAFTDGMGIPAAELYYLEHRMSVWGGGNVANGFDVGMYTVPGYNSRKLFETAFSVRRDEGRRTRALFRKMTSKLAPGLAGI